MRTVARKVRQYRKYIRQDLWNSVYELHRGDNSKDKYPLLMAQVDSQCRRYFEQENI